MKRVVALDPSALKGVIRRRRMCGGDRYDEVWNGVYVMSPLADNVHQHLVFGFSTVIGEALRGIPNVTVLPGANISDQEEHWNRNFRVPDVVAFLPGNPAEDRGTHYLGGPDFAVEVASKRDRSRKKFDFYAKVGVRELLIVGRDPWVLELYRRDAESFELVGKSNLILPEELKSTVLPPRFRLISGESRPMIEAIGSENDRTWTI